MPLVSMRQLLDHAAEHDYGLPAFNVNNMEQARAIMRAANDTDSPVILQGTTSARQYAGEVFLRHQVLAALELYPHLPVAVHQDHGQTPHVCQAAIRSGFSSVMMDGSLLEDGKTPSTYAYNVEVTRKVVELAHAVGISVEGELGVVGPLQSGHPTGDQGGPTAKNDMLTDPEEAAAFVKATHVDALAIAIGTSHGAYKFTAKPTNDQLPISRIKDIAARIPNTHLVIHGGSTVSADLVAIINEGGGAIPETYGTPLEEIIVGIKYGVRKVNIDTDLRLAMTGAIRRYLSTHRLEFDPRQYMRPAEDAAYAVCKARYEAFGSAGWGSGIKPITLERMAERYAVGILNPRVA
ncbi:MAG: fructose-bisphosphate aldolase class II [Magnetococcales bacterium]|nr:fructose-bisphosphate aldolase class II [Magnetococcales bacterium]MBF0322594.1 fructose-bisphosphate aldolase class II [Magnetococcales bacterium]